MVSRRRARPLPVLLIALALAVPGVMPAAAAGAPVSAEDGSGQDLPVGTLAVANDDFSEPIVISSLPYTHAQEITEATTAADDPLIPCAWGGPDQSFQTVWYRYTASVTAPITADTIGSGYDTQLAVWTGGRGSLTNVACSEDAVGPSFSQSEVQFTATAGTTYYVEVASYYFVANYYFDPGDPQLILNVARTDTIEALFASQAAVDGWVRESGEDTTTGSLTLNATNTTARLGDDAADRQYRAILDFDTSALPDNAVVTSVTLRIKRQSVVGANPLNTHGLLLVDIKTGSFHAIPDLEKFDFQAPASRSNVGRFIKAPTDGWYRAPLRDPAFSRINLTGHTQFRLRFELDDNDDGSADLLSFYSGNAPTDGRPQLTVDYYVP